MINPQIYLINLFNFSDKGKKTSGLQAGKKTKIFETAKEFNWYQYSQEQHTNQGKKQATLAKKIKGENVNQGFYI